MPTELNELRQAQAVQEERMNTVRSETQAAVDRLVASIAEDGKRRAEERTADSRAQAKRDAQHAKEQAKQAKELNRNLWFAAATVTGIITLVLTLLHYDQQRNDRQQPPPIYIYNTPPVAAPAPGQPAPAAPLAVAPQPARAQPQAPAAQPAPRQQAAPAKAAP